MSLSKKNLDKLNNFKNNKNLNDNNSKVIDNSKIDYKDNSTNKRHFSEDPNKIFYALIDNSQSLDETSKVNHSLRESELNQINMNSRKQNYSKKLTTEEELYDEFNYLLDE
jgi:hypothetical protein